MSTTTLRTGALPRGLALVDTFRSFGTIGASFFALVVVEIGCSVSAFLLHLIWAWIKAPDLDALEDARNELILNLDVNEKEYLVGWYQPKEPQFCHAYTCQ